MFFVFSSKIEIHLFNKSIHNSLYLLFFNVMLIPLNKDIIIFFLKLKMNGFNLMILWLLKKKLSNIIVIMLAYYFMKK